MLGGRGGVVLPRDDPQLPSDFSEGIEGEDELLVGVGGHKTRPDETVL